MNDLLFVVTLVAALGCGLIAGFFYAFSTVIMKALARLPPEQGIATMKTINVVVINPWFMAAFLGTAAGCALLVVSPSTWEGPGRVYVLAGSLLYLVGTILVTMVCNVPRNNALAAVDPATAEAARVWTDYLATWTRWNHVRTGAALAAAVLLTVALGAVGGKAP